MCIVRKATLVDPSILPFESWPSDEKTRAWSSPGIGHAITKCTFTDTITQTKTHRYRYTLCITQTETHKYTDRDTQTHMMTDKQTEQHHQHNDKCFVRWWHWSWEHFVVTQVMWTSLIKDNTQKQITNDPDTILITSRNHGSLWCL